MNWSLSLAESWWWVLVSVLVGLCYAAILYYRNQKIEELFKPWVRNLLMVSRFLVASLLVLLLLGPVLKYLGFNEEKPIIALLIDDSNSLEGQITATEANGVIEDITKGLSEKYRVESYAFSNRVSPASTINLKGTETNLSQALGYLSENYVNQNLGGAILVSDGINNAGSSPEFISEKIKRPVFTIGVGDTTRYADIAIKNVLHNSIAYLGSEFAIKVELNAELLQGENVQLDFLENDKRIASKPIQISSNSWFAEVDLQSAATKVGRTKYTIRVNALNKESNKANNTYVFYVDVIDGKKKVVLWADAPHPDLGALVSAINKNENYSAEIVLNSFDVHSETDLVILHNWFKNDQQLSLFEKLKSSGIATWVILGNDFNAGVFNRASIVPSFSASGSGRLDALPRFNVDFQFFEVSKEQQRRLNDWSPLLVPFGKFSGIKPSEVAMFQSIGNVDTEQPLLSLFNSNYRMGMLSGTGLWRWRLLDFEKNGTHENFEELIAKTIQFLAVKDNKQLLKVYPTARQYGVGEQVTLLGELYNQSLEALANEEINVVVVDEEGKRYKHTMSANGNQYRLILKGLKAGNYSFTATSIIGGVELKDQGYFEVQGQQKERLNLTADFQRLKKISKSTGGVFFTLENVPQLIERLQQDDELKTIIREDTKVKDLLDFSLFFWLFVVLLTFEWLVRKLGGTV